MTRVNLSKLPDKKKQFAWAWLQDNKPALAALLSQDDVRFAQKTFDADVIIELESSEIEALKKKFAQIRSESV